jgi:hypothetical protein
MIISQYRSHSGAPRSGEPGIHNPQPWLWIPGLALSGHPGMTKEIMLQAMNKENGT